MAWNLKKLDNIDVERQMVVSGYIHEYESMNKQNIPKEIILICILFYGYGVDEWDVDQISIGMQLSDRKLTKVKRGVLYASSSYCKRIIECGTFLWRFKIDDCSNGVGWDDGGKFMIGIWKVNGDEEPQTDTYFTRDGDGYGFDPVGGVISNDAGYTSADQKYGVKCKNGTIVEMLLDMNELTLSYKINDKDYGKAFDVEKCKYRAAVYMLTENDAITLLK